MILQRMPEDERVLPMNIDGQRLVRCAVALVAGLSGLATTHYYQKEVRKTEFREVSTDGIIHTVVGTGSPNNVMVDASGDLFHVIVHL
jgi:hypothetical protein